MTFGKCNISDVFLFLLGLRANLIRTARYREQCMWDDIYGLFVVTSESSRNSLV